MILTQQGKATGRGQPEFTTMFLYQKDPQAKSIPHLQPTVVPFSSGFVCCFLSSYGHLISFHLLFFDYSKGVFQLLPQRLFHVSHSADITVHSMPRRGERRVQGAAALGGKSEQIVEVNHKRTATLAPQHPPSSTACRHASAQRCISRSTPSEAFRSNHSLGKTQLWFHWQSFIEISASITKPLRKHFRFMESSFQTLCSLSIRTAMTYKCLALR